MKFLTMQQGTTEWLQARSGLVTASCFADAISTVGGLDERQQKYVDLVLSGKAEKDAASEAGYKTTPSAESIKRALRGETIETPSDTALRYAADLAFERVNGGPFQEPPKAWVMQRGHEMEAQARMLYEARTGAFVTESGLCVDDDDVFAYSSDGLVDDDGLIEVKAPVDSIKIMEMWRTGDVSEYICQIQGGLWLTGRKWLDFLMYAPMLKNVGKELYVKRICRDEEFIDSMALKLSNFEALIKNNLLILKA